MTHWNHRIVRKKIETPRGIVTQWGVHEVFYGKDGRPEMWTEEPESVDTCSDLGGPLTDNDARMELRQTLEWMMKALDHPIIDWGDVQTFDWGESSDGEERSETE